MGSQYVNDFDFNNTLDRVIGAGARSPSNNPLARRVDLRQFLRALMMTGGRQ